MPRYLQEIEREKLTRRLNRLRTLLIIFGVLILIRFWQLQIHQGEKWKLIATENQIRKIRVPASRGLILDRRGRILAGNRPGFNITVIPADINQETRERLAKILKESPEDLEQEIQKNQRWSPFVPIKLKENLSWQELSEIEEQLRELSGVDIELEPVRAYPRGNTACHILGYLGEISPRELSLPEFAGYNLGDMVGKAGVERAYEPELRGEDGYKFKVVDALGKEKSTEILSGLKLTPKPPVPGANLYLTIDLELQEYAQSLLSGKKGAIVVISVKSGEILTMASSPGFNPEIFVNRLHPEEWLKLEKDPTHPLYNRAIQGTYPPGSVFKLVVAIAGLEENLINPKQKVLCRGIYYLGRKPFGCWRAGGHGRINLEQAIVQSCDVYFYQLGKKLGINQMAHYANLLGLGLKSGIELDNEKSGLIPTSFWKEKIKKEKWNPGDTLNASIGQGYVLVTPLQSALLAMVIANQGKLWKPQIARKLVNEKGEIKELVPQLVHQINFASSTWEKIKKAMWGVVNQRKGTAYWTARSSKIEIAGKTGTAQVVRGKEFKGKKLEEIPEQFRDHAWFIAFAPFDHPQIAVSVVVENAGHGSTGAAPLAKKIIEKYFEIYPEKISQK